MEKTVYLNNNTFLVVPDSKICDGIGFVYYTQYKNVSGSLISYDIGVSESFVRDKRVKNMSAYFSHDFLDSFFMYAYKLDINDMAINERLYGRHTNELRTRDLNSMRDELGL